MFWAIIRIIIRRIIRRIFGNNFYWRKRRANWEVAYWDTKSQLHRTTLMNVLSKIDFSSILEIGCNCGPNLARVLEINKTIDIAGIDLNKKAIELAKKKMPNGDFRIGEVENLPYKDKSFDIVLTDAVLIYVSRQKILKVKQEIERVAKKVIVMVEWHDSKGNAIGKRKKSYWIRNYTALFKRPVEVIKINNWGGDWNKYGYIIIIKL